MMNSASTADTTNHRPQSAPLWRSWLVGLILIALIVVIAYFFLPPSGDSAVVAIVNGEQITQSDVDVQANLTQALNEVFKQGGTAVNPDDVLSKLVLQKLQMQAVRAQNYRISSPSEVDDYINAIMSMNRISSSALNASLSKFGLAPSVFSESVRLNLTIENYKNEVVVGRNDDQAQKDLKLNNWIAGLYGGKAQISYPNKLRTASGPAAKVNREAPNLVGTDLNSGQRITLSGLKGKPLLINFWATWCTPCREEMPEIVRTANLYRDKGLVVLAISTEEDGAAERVKQFMREFKMSFPTLLDGDQRPNATAYRVQALPSSFMIDRTGIVRYVRYGVMTREMIDSTLKLILP